MHGYRPSRSTVWLDLCEIRLYEKSKELLICKLPFQQYLCLLLRHYIFGWATCSTVQCTHMQLEEVGLNHEAEVH